MPFDVAKFDRQLLVEHYEAEMQQYQIDAATFLYDNPYSAGILDTGLGKTIVALTVTKWLHEFEGYQPTLVVAPLRVAVQQWPNEIASWSHTCEMTYTLIRADDYADEIKSHGRWAKANAIKNGATESEAKKIGLAGAAEKKMQILRMLALRKSDIHIINREALSTLVQMFLFKNSKQWPFKRVFIDEASGFKDWKTDRFKSMAKARRFTSRLHLLTATPAAESYANFFALTYLLDQGARFGDVVSPFFKKYFVQEAYTKKIFPRPGAEEQILNKISDIFYVMRGEDYLPDVLRPVIAPRNIVLSRDEMKQYRRFEREFIMEVDEGVFVEAKNSGVLAGKLLQLASGAVYDAAHEYHVIHDYKLDALDEIIQEETGKNILVAYWFKASLERIKRRFPHAVVLDRQGSQVADWNAGNIPVLLVHPQSAAYGLNLQHGGHIFVIYDLFYSLELWIQLLARLARQGQKHLVRVFPLITRNTLDEIAMNKLKGKKDGEAAIRARLVQLRKLYSGQSA